MRPSSLRFVRPKARSGVVQKLGDEVLVYDPLTHTAHCLTETAAAIWKLCDGHSGVQEVIVQLESQCHLTLKEDVVLMVLQQLGNAGLLLKPFELELDRVSPRQALHRIGRAAALTLPFVVSVAVPTPSEAVSCLPGGATCTHNSDCCSHLCVLGRCVLGSRRFASAKGRG
jgi:hypothetical protein